MPTETEMKRRIPAVPAIAAVPAAALFLALVSCVTINVYFPAAAIKDLSNQIEDEVQKKAAEAPKADAPKPGSAAPDPANPPQGKPDAAKPGSTSSAETTLPHRGSAGSAGLIDALLGISPVYAAEGEVAAPEVSSPAIRKIIDSRAARAGALGEYKSKGVIGESNQALVEIRKLDALPDLKARAEVQRLIKAENSDREELFKEIAAAKGVELSQLPKIRETYASTLREKARSGDWIQEPNGAWKQK